eukprot:symbB.v1.2.030754.t1/scaffold3500.1/size56953/6
MTYSISFHVQTERRCKFIKRFDVSDGEVGTHCIAVKEYMQVWICDNTSIRTVMLGELSVKHEGQVLNDTDAVPAGSHIQVIFTNMTDQLALWSRTEAGRRAEQEFQRALSSHSDPAPSSSTDAPTSSNQEAGSCGFASITHHIKKADEHAIAYGYRIGYINGEPHVLTPHGVYVAWDSASGFVEFCSQNSVVVIHDLQDYMNEILGVGCNRDVAEYIFEKMSDADEERLKEKAPKVIREDEFDDDTFLAYILSQTSHAEREKVREILDARTVENVQSSEDETREPQPDFKPFTGKPMKLGGYEGEGEKPKDEKDDTDTIHFITVKFLEEGTFNTKVNFQKSVAQMKQKIVSSASSLKPIGKWNYSKDPKDYKFLVGEDYLMNNRKAVKSVMEPSDVITVLMRSRGGGKLVKNPAIKQNLVDYKKQQLTNQVKKTNTIHLQNLDGIFKKTNDFMFKVHEKMTEPKAVFASLLSPMSVEQLNVCLEAFKVNRQEARIEKLTKALMKPHLPEIFQMRDGFDEVFVVMTQLVDVVLTMGYMKDTTEWDWAAVKRTVSHFKEVKELGASASSEIDALTSALGSASI